MSRSALIGSTGFVGGALRQQCDFDEFFSSSNIHELNGHFDTIYCAAAPGQKWLANQDPASDRETIATLLKALLKVTAETVVLISTVDVFSDPVGVDEETVPSKKDLSPYGLHRLELEEELACHFDQSLTVRLPGLVGPGLRKNAIYDLHNGNNLMAIDSRAVFQFYPTVNLFRDIQIGLQHNLSLLHLSSEPTSIDDVADFCFGREFFNELMAKIPRYDFQSVHASVFGRNSLYQYSAPEVFQLIRDFHQTEPVAPSVGLS